MKICVIIPSHSPSQYTKLTVGTLLRTVGKNHDLNIHVGVHSNYSDYTSDFSMFEEFRNITQIHCVDEIDWIEYFDDNYRYSRMHCKNMENLFKNIKYYDFDYLVVLDNDMYIKSDFISQLTENKTDYDFIFDFYENQNKIRIVDTERGPDGLYNRTTYFAPKIAGWNIIISRKLFDRIIDNISIIYPEKIQDKERILYYKNFYPEINENYPLLFDTWAKLMHMCLYEWNDLNIKNVNGEFEKLIEHYFCSSFNYGMTIIGNKEGESKISKIYKLEFPNGLTEYQKR